jgi:hypothetical protein
MLNKLLNMRPGQRLLVMLPVVCIAMVVAWFVAMVQRDQAREARQQQSDDAHATQKAEAPLSQLKSASHQASEMSRRRTNQEIKVVDDWFKKVGFATEQQRAYELQYTDEQLQSLVDKGDVVAMDALLNRIQQREWQDFEQKVLALNAAGDVESMTEYLNSQKLRDDSYQISLMEKGITYGSFNAIMAMGRKLRPVLNSDDSPSVRLANKQQLVERLSYFELLRLRGAGGLYAANGNERVDLEYFERQYGEKLIAEDRIKINERARELYDHYQSERRKLGLGDFDNSMPDEVRDFLGE